MHYVRCTLVAALLKSGKVLVTGGSKDCVDATNTAELYDPSTGTWAITGNMIYAGVFHTASVLTNGSMLVSGGGLDDPSSNSA